MKTERRHELQTNQLADWIGHQITWAQRYTLPFVATLIAGIVLILAVVYMMRSKTAAEGAHWRTYILAAGPVVGSSGGDPGLLLQAIEDFPNDLPGQWAALTLADNEYQEGVDALFTDRSSAITKLGQAADRYEKLRESGLRTYLKSRATFGLAKTYEAEGQLSKARDTYEALIKEWPDAIYVQEAKQRIESLQRNSTESFYSDLARYEPGAAITDAPGTPGNRPAFDIKSLDNSGGGLRLKLEDSEANSAPTGTVMPPQSEPEKKATGKPATSPQPTSQPSKNPAAEVKKPVATEPAKVESAAPATEAKPASAKPVDTPTKAPPSETAPNKTPPAEPGKASP